MRTLVLLISLFCFTTLSPAQSFKLKSPDNNLQVTVKVGEKIEYSVTHGKTKVLAPSAISMTLKDGTTWGEDPSLIDKKWRSVDQTLSPVLYKKGEIHDRYNELVMTFDQDYRLIFRAYDQGVAYRFATTRKKESFVRKEGLALNFYKDYNTLVPYVRKFDPANFQSQFFHSFETTYSRLKLSELDSSRLMFLPMLVELDDGKKLCFTEADLESYPGLYLARRPGTRSLSGVFAPYPKNTRQGGHNELQQIVTEQEDYIATFTGPRSFPWRVLVVSENDKQLLDNDLVYQLASPSRIKDLSWIKPGKVAWDWWNDLNIYGVDFKAGVNNETYQYYIDFASKYGIEYVILDEGWAVNKAADLFQVVPEIDLQAIIDYGAERNVGIILWAGYWAMDRDMEEVCRVYSNMGVKGFKVDFMNRDDQAMVDFYYRCAATAARYKLIVDFHGAYKPTGLQRTYPNVLNVEGVFGLEQMKWSKPEVDMVTYDVTMPYIRMLAGPVDYTQGAMRNAGRGAYQPLYSEPMSQGTRCRQLAEYVVFESPLNMLCDSPSNYRNEPECTRFIADIPTTWDRTIALDGILGKYIVMAREKDGEWYVGAMTNWDKRELTIDLSFLTEGQHRMEIFKDGVNADRSARDYKREVLPVPVDKKLKVKLMPGGGFAAKITRIKH